MRNFATAARLTWQADLKKLSSMICAFNSVCETIDKQIARGREILRSTQNAPAHAYIDVSGDRANCLSFLGRRQISKIGELQEVFDRLDANVRTNSKLYGPTRSLQMLAYNDIERSRLVALFKARQAKYDAWANASGYAENCAELQRLEKMHETLAAEIISHPCRTIGEVRMKAEFVIDIFDGDMTDEENLVFLKSLAGRP